MADQVDIRALYSLPIENLDGLEFLSPQAINRRLRGTDLVYSSKDKSLERLNGKKTSIRQEAAMVNMLRNADTDRDGFLELTEAQVLLEDQFQKSGTQIYPRQFLDGAQKLMRFRYGPLLENIKRIDGKAQSHPILYALELYNNGLLQEDTRHAHATLPYNGLTKSVTNAVFFLPSALHNAFVDDEDEAPLMIGDALAATGAEKRYHRAQGAIRELERIFDQGVQRGEAWAFAGDLEKAAEKLSGADREIILHQLAGRQIYSILNTSDPDERFKKLEAFAEGERPGALGFGGGNTSDASFWNYTGRKSNLYFARSIYHYLVKKASSGENPIDEARRIRARKQLDRMKGNGGSFTNMAMVGLTQIISLGGLWFEPTPYRAWGDADSMDCMGRFANGLLALWGGHQGIKGIREAWNLRRVHGLNGLRQVWWQNARLWKPLPHGALAEAAAAEGTVYKMTTVDRLIDGGLAAVRWPFRQLFRPFGWMGQRLKAGLPPISPGQEAALAKTASFGSKGMDKLVHGILVLSVMQYADDKISGPISPFEMGFREATRRTANFNQPGKLQDFDPLLYPQGPPHLKPTRLNH